MSQSLSASVELSSYAIEDTQAHGRWHALWLKSEQRSPFSTISYASAISSAIRCNCTIYLIEQAGTDIGGWLVFSKKKGPFNRTFVPPFTPYTSLLTTPSFTEAMVHSSQNGYTELLDLLARSHDSLRFHLHPSIADTRLFQWRQWQVSPLYTYRIELNHINETFASWSESARRTFRKHKHAYQFTESPEAVHHVITLCEQSYSRNSRNAPASQQQVKQLVDSLHAAGCIRTFTVKHESERQPSGGVIVLHSGKEAYYWIAGSIPGPAMTVLLGNLLPILKADGFETFDFVGANTKPIAEFKRRFGPVLVPYYAITRVTNKWMAALDALRTLGRR